MDADEVTVLEFDTKSPLQSGGATEADTAMAEGGLIERAKADPEAFGQLFEAHYDTILTYTYRCTLNLAAAEDLTSNTFFKALRGLPKYRPSVWFSAWLYRIAMNEVRMHWRSERRRRATTQKGSDFHAPDCAYIESLVIENEEDRAARMRAYARLHELIGQLPHRDRTVIMLRFFESLPYREIADVLGRRIGTVKSLVHRALRRLRPIVEQDATICATRHLDL